MKYIKWALLISTFSVSVSVLGAPNVSIDAPAENSVQSGVTQIYGWASDDVSVTSVVMFIDGQEDKMLSLGRGGDRRDVESAFPDDFDPLHSGFATAFHTKLIGNGPHTITIVVTNENREETRVKRTIVVSNAPETEVLSDQIDLSGAVVRISDGHMFLDGIVVNGVTYNNFDLSFDHSINGFRVNGFREDLNHDGYADDDMDHDGYHDDDSDHDGFHDDDVDHDGFHDDGGGMGGGMGGGPGHN